MRFLLFGSIINRVSERISNSNIYNTMKDIILMIIAAVAIVTVALPVATFVAGYVIGLTFLN